MNLKNHAESNDTCKTGLATSFVNLFRKSKDEKQLVLPFHPSLPRLAADKVVALNVPGRDFSFYLFKDIMFWFSSYFKIKPLVAAALYL